MGVEASGSLATQIAGFFGTQFGAGAIVGAAVVLVAFFVMKNK